MSTRSQKEIWRVLVAPGMMVVTVSVTARVAAPAAELPRSVLVVTDMMRAWSVNTSAGTSAANTSTYVLSPGLPVAGALAMLVPGCDAARAFVSCAYAIVLMMAPLHACPRRPRRRQHIMDQLRSSKPSNDRALAS